MKAQGWDHDIIAFARAGGRVTGVCGGFQLLGKSIHDPDGLDGAPGSTEALGLLDIVTLMQPGKQVRPVHGHCPRSNAALSGYEIHIGNSEGADTRSPMTILAEHPDGAVSADGQIEGTYLHGLFGNDHFRAWWLNGLSAGAAGSLNYDATVEQELDILADGLEASLDVDGLLRDASSLE